MVIETHDPEETFEVGRTIGMNAKPGQIYTLTGDLGVGKTVFTQGVAALPIFCPRAKVSSGFSVSIITQITFFLAELFFAYYNRAHKEKQYFLQKEIIIMANKNPIVTITMENGDVMKAELYPEVAPNTVNNFISLVKKGFYDGLIFHRVINGFMIQGGCPEGTGMGGPGYSIKGEFAQNGVANDLAHTPGVLSMARAMHPNSGGSQFFIMHKAAPHLDGSYAAFGKVIEGMDVVNKIAETETDFRDRPLDDQEIKSMTVDTFGVDYPEPEKC